MKTLLITGALFFSGIWVLTTIHYDELQDNKLYFAQKSNQHLIDSLKRVIRFGPKPYCVANPKFPRTAKEQDSVMQYFSHFTTSELREVREGSTNEHTVAFVNLLIEYKDSIYFEKNGCPASADD